MICLNKHGWLGWNKKFWSWHHSHTVCLFVWLALFAWLPLTNYLPDCTHSAHQISVAHSQGGRRCEKLMQREQPQEMPAKEWARLVCPGWAGLVCVQLLVSSLVRACVWVTRHSSLSSLKPVWFSSLEWIRPSVQQCWNACMKMKSLLF